MRVQKRIPWLLSLGAVLAAMALGTTQAEADVISDRPGSVVIWPKVIADGTRDTLIALTNTSNLQAYAHCEYVVGTGTCSLIFPGETSARYCSMIDGSGCPEILGGPPNVCEITWQTSDFDVSLTRQQPTIWRVSTGRVEDLFLPRNGQCVEFIQDGTLRESCPGLFLIGNVPPAPPAPLLGADADDPTFRGELRCIQITQDGNAFAGNALKGEAIIETVFPPSTNISKYNSINVLGIAGVDPDSPDVIELNGIGYNACPEAVEFTTYAPGASDIAAGSLGATCTTSDCAVRTEITLVPCRANFLTEQGARFNAFFEIWNEFESPLSAETRFDCWATVDYEDIGIGNNTVANSFFHTRVTSTGSGLCIAGENEGLIGCTSDTTPPNLDGTGIAGCGAGGVCAPVSGVLAIVEEFHSTDNSIGEFAGVGTDASNGYSFDANRDGSIQRRGRCRNALTTQCTADAQCPVGRCRIATATACTTDADCTGVDDFCDRCMNDEIAFDADPIAQ